MIAGIDPGKNGALALLAIDSKDWVLYPFSKHTMPEISGVLKSDLFNIRHAFLEKLNSNPKNGRIANFKLGESYGTLKGLFIAAKIPLDEVLAVKWQRSLGCLSGGDKKVTRSKAQQLFPHISEITHGTADALLIAEYGRRWFQRFHADSELEEILG